MTKAPTALVLSFPCRHKRDRQQRADGSLLPCAVPGCVEGFAKEVDRYHDRINPPFTFSYERRVTGGGTSRLQYLWRVLMPVLCCTCGKPVERQREDYAQPTCYACLPPPPPLKRKPVDKTGRALLDL